MARLKKLTACWYIARAGRSLTSKLRLALFLHEFYTELAEDIKQQSNKTGELESLKAFQTILDEQIKNV